MATRNQPSAEEAWPSGSGAIYVFHDNNQLSETIPENRLARPDPVDMDEDELKLCSEA